MANLLQPINVYIGTYEEGDGKEYYITYGKVVPGALPTTYAVHEIGEPLPLYLEVFNHSPSGFAWGYNGSGPAQAALAILMHFMTKVARPRGMSQQEIEEAAVRSHQVFKDFFLTKVPQTKGWVLTVEQVRAFMNLRLRSEQLEQ